MAIPDPNTTDWVPIWHPESAGAQGPQGPPGATGPQGPAGINGTAVPHHVTHEPGGSDALVNAAWTNIPNLFTREQEINQANPYLIFTDNIQPVDAKKFVVQNTAQALVIFPTNDAVTTTPARVTFDRSGALRATGGIVAAGGFTGPNYNFNGSFDVSNPVVLDHYERGSWTPVLIPDFVPATGQIFDIQVGRYTRIGRQVFCQYDVRIANVGTGGSGLLLLGGLPFVHNSSMPGPAFVAWFDVLGGGYAVNNLYMLIYSGLPSGPFYYKNAITGSMDGQLLYPNSLGVGTRFIGSITYMVD